MNTYDPRHNIERWEVYIKHQDNIGPYIGYIKALFHDDKREYCILRGRGNAIETVLKVVQMAKDELGSIHSIYSCCLQKDDGSHFNERDSGTKIDNPEDLSTLPKHKIVPMIQVLLSTQELNYTDPGYERPSIKVQPILTMAKGKINKSGKPSRVLRNSTAHNVDPMKELKNKIKFYDFDLDANELNHFHCDLHKSQPSCRYNCSQCHCALQQKIDATNFHQSTKIWGNIPLRKKYSVQDDVIKTSLKPRTQDVGRRITIPAGKCGSKRYNDENVNYANLQQRFGNKFGLEGQLGCSKIEIEKKRQLALQLAKQNAPKEKNRPKIYQQPADDEDDFQVNVTSF